ncbi:MAG TPA: ATP-binding protein, partial [Bryobacteraceae bacterium]|nr:ATP-binding protein [Bryobacteraceae bacterium]
ELEETNRRLRAEIEQRKQIEEELLRARKLESLGVLAGGIAHDFNNFLTVVQGNLALAQMQLPENDPAQPLLQQTVAVCRRAASLASQLLTFAKGGTPVRRTLSIAALVRDTVELARAGAPVNIQAEIAEDLWSCDADADQISHALRNVLLNARDATPEGGLVEVRAENTVLEDRGTGWKPGRYVRITVRDCGSGIAPEVLPRIFDPYFTTKPGATGLGLATAYAIVSKHEGRIWAESEPGVGTVMRIELPASGAPIQAPPPEPVLARGSGRILVMDDEEFLRMLLTRILQPLGYEVTCARDGAEAIASYDAARAAGRSFDAVLLDLTVRGGMGGLETAARLREIDPAVKLIVSSGYSDAAVMSDFRRYGFDERIPKPWTPAQISDVLQRVLKSRDAGE